MKYKVVFSKQAIDDLEKTPKNTAIRIVEKIKFYSEQSNPVEFAKKLVGTKTNYRFRIGNFRAIFELRANGEIRILLILRIAHRRESYE